MNSDGKRSQGTFEFKRFVWPYILTKKDDGTIEVNVTDAICPRCRGRAAVSQSGNRVLLDCRRCNISASYSPFGSYAELKDHVRGLILGEMES